MPCTLPTPATVAYLVVACARRRTESRGLHTMTDFPETDPAEAHDTVLEARAAA